MLFKLFSTGVLAASLVACGASDSSSDEVVNPGAETPEPVAEPTPEPVGDQPQPNPEPITEPNPQPEPQPNPEPIAEPNPEPVVEPEPVEPEIVDPASTDPEPVEAIVLTPADIEFNRLVPGVNLAENIPYSTDPRQRFDLYVPTNTNPEGILIYYHGGGFKSGNENNISEDLLRAMLTEGYAVASATYRLIDGSHDEGVKRSLFDAKYALQFIRYHGATLDINTDNMVLAGTSAGASAALWLAMQDDLADADAHDVVLRESTRVKGIALKSTQATLDIQRWQEDENMLAEFNLSDEQAIALGGGEERALAFYGIEMNQQNLAEPLLSWQTPETQAYRQSVDMLGFFTSDDPELYVDNNNTTSAPTNGNEYLHHAWHARALHLAADHASVPGKFYYGPASDRTFASEPAETQEAFLLRKLAE